MAKIFETLKRFFSQSKNHLKGIFLKWVIIFISTIGFASGVVQLFPNIGQRNIVIIFILGCPTASVLATTLIYRKRLYISNEVLLFDVGEKQVPTLHFPCNDQLFKGANKLARESFGKDGLTFAQVAEWKAKNPYILTCLTDQQKFVGYFDILPLTDEFGARFKEGKVTEKDIDGHSILSFESMRACNFIYFSGIAIRDSETDEGKKHGGILLRASFEYLKLFFDLEGRGKRVYALPITECGQKIITKLGFTLDVDGYFREDGYNFYSRVITKNDVDDILRKIGRLDRLYDFSCYRKFLKNSVIHPHPQV